MRNTRKKVREFMDLEKMKLVESIPDEIWLKIFEIGLENSILTQTDLCSLSISSKHFNKLSSDDSLWSTLLTQHFPAKDHTSSSSQPFQAISSSKKNLFKCIYKLELDFLQDEVNEIRSELHTITRQLRQARGRITKQKERWEAMQEYSDDRQTWYRQGLEWLEVIKEKRDNARKRVSKLHANCKKNAKKFHM